MNKSHIYKVVILTFMWIMFREQFSPRTLAVGTVLGAGCVYFYYKYLPLNRPDNISFFRAAIYLFYLLGQIYLSGFYVIKLIFKGAKADVVNVKTKLESEAMKIMLADSITLTPGTITLGLNDDGSLDVLWLREKDDNRDTDIDDIIKGNLERHLIKVQK